MKKPFDKEYEDERNKKNLEYEEIIKKMKEEFLRKKKILEDLKKKR